MNCFQFLETTIGFALTLRFIENVFAFTVEGQRWFCVLSTDQTYQSTKPHGPDQRLEPALCVWTAFNR